MRRAWRATLATTAAAVVAGAGTALALAAPASGAAPRLSVSKHTVSAGATQVRVQVSGRGYLVPPHPEGTDVPGGVYVFFGWVKPGGKWGPSNRNSNNNNGNFGVTYNHPGDQGDAGTRDSGAGAIRFVSFTSGGTSGEATPYHMDGRGNWTATVTIPAATYTYRAVDGSKHKVDCRTVTCGIYTIGAHGKSSATNEVFTPITFTSATAPAKPSVSPSPKPSATASPKPSTQPSRTKSASAEPSRSSSPPAPTSSAADPVPSSSSMPPTSTAAESDVVSSPPATVAAEPADGDGGSPAGMWAGLAAVVVALGAGGAWWLRRGAG